MATLMRETAHLGALGLSDADLARATGAARSTARGWLNETSAPTGDRAERVIELSALAERLEQVMETDYISVWLRKPIAMLGEDKPLDVIGRGDYRLVAAVIAALEDAPAV